MSTLAAIMNKDPKPAMELNPAVPRELDRIINHCLRKDPARRFQHVDDLKVELEELKEESDSGRLAGAKPAMQPTQRRTWVWAGAALVFLAMATAIWIFREFTRKPAVAPEVVPLTSHAGFEEFPSFSPDGNQVAFSWNGEKQDNFDIYIKLIGSANSVRLTTDPADDVNPVFSPNGRSIGFIRMSKGHATFMIIPVIGGRESVVAEVPSLELGFFLAPSFAWFPDGKWVVTDGLTLLSTESGETRTLTSQVMKSSTNFSPAVSPDGRTVAFSRSAVYAASDVYLLDLTEDLKPKRGTKTSDLLEGSQLRFGLDSQWAGDYL